MWNPELKTTAERNETKKAANEINCFKFKLLLLDLNQGPSD